MTPREMVLAATLRDRVVKLAEGLRDTLVEAHAQELLDVEVLRRVGAIVEEAVASACKLDARHPAQLRAAIDVWGEGES